MALHLVSYDQEFQAQGLRLLHQQRDSSGVRADHVNRLRRLLASLDVAQTAADMNRPGYRLHRLHGKLDTFWAVNVSGNWRVVFRFVGTDVELVDYLDYH